MSKLPVSPQEVGAAVEVACVEAGGNAGASLVEFTVVDVGGNAGATLVELTAIELSVKAGAAVVELTAGETGGYAGTSVLDVVAWIEILAMLEVAIEIETLLDAGATDDWVLSVMDTGMEKPWE